MLGRIAPGLGHVSPTDFRSAFVIKDRAFHGKDILLEGDVIRLNADGSYGFEQQLDFNVKVRFLREGAIGKVVELLTIPLTTLLLDFDLGGTLADPKWRPDNLPKELFFIYD